MTTGESLAPVRRELQTTDAVLNGIRVGRTIPSVCVCEASVYSASFCHKVSMGRVECDLHVENRINGIPGYPSYDFLVFVEYGSTRF